MLYYILLIVAALGFALSFYCNRNVERLCEKGIDTTILFMGVSQMEAFTVLFVLIKGQLQFTLFTLICLFFQVILLTSFTFLNFKTLGLVNVAKYSLYTMLGGMLIPFAYGIIFAKEPFSLTKVLCLVFITAALVFDAKGSKTRKKELKFLFAVFTVNGLFGVVSTVHQNSPRPHVDTLEYMCLQSLIISLCCGVFLTVKLIKNKRLKAVKSKKAYVHMLLYGVVYYGAELILLISIKQVDASVQYPIITGGVMVFSTVLGFLTGDTKDKKALISVALSMAGLLCLIC